MLRKLEEIEPLLSERGIVAEWRSETRLVLRGVIRFIDGSRLVFLEYLVERGGAVHRIAYRFHYEDARGNMVFRYDNAPHHPGLPTFPHHKHLGDGRVVAAREPSLPSVIDEVVSLLRRTDSGG